MGTTSLTFQISGVSELIGYIAKIQGKMAGLDQSMSKAQLSTEMSRVERLLKEAGTFANTLYTALQKVEQTNVQKTADGLKAVGKESVDASGKVVESSTKMSAAMTKSTEAVKKAATTHAEAHKTVGNSALSTGKLMDSFAGSIMSVVTGYASIQTVVTAVTAAFQENARVIQEAQTSMQNYAKVSGQLGQKASTTQELGQYRAVVQRLAESGAVTDRAEASNIAYAMLSANMPIEAVEQMIPALQAGLFSSSDLSGIIKAAGPLMTRNKDVNINQLMSMAATASKTNVSDTAKIVQSVAASDMMSQELGWGLEESFALSDVIARATPNADEAKVWQKNFTKDVWKKVLAKAALAKMKAINPEAETMEGLITGYDSKGNPIVDSNFRMSFSEFGEWAKEYYGGDMNRVKKDFADIRGSQGALAVIAALMNGSYQESLANIQHARTTDLVAQKARMTMAASPELRAQQAQRAAQAQSDIANEAEAAIKVYWDAERKNYASAATSPTGKFFREWGNWFNSWGNVESWTTEGMVRQLWNSPYLSQEQKNDVMFQYARANPNISASDRYNRKEWGERLAHSKRHGYGLPEEVQNGTDFGLAFYNARLQVAAGATQYTPVTGLDAFDDKAVVNMAQAAENAANALNKAAEAADKAAQKLQNQVMPTPGQSGQLTPATL